MCHPGPHFLRCKIWKKDSVGKSPVPSMQSYNVFMEGFKKPKKNNNGILKWYVPVSGITEMYR